MQHRCPEGWLDLPLQPSTLLLPKLDLWLWYSFYIINFSVLNAGGLFCQARYSSRAEIQVLEAEIQVAGSRTFDFGH